METRTPGGWTQEGWVVANKKWVVGYKELGGCRQETGWLDARKWVVGNKDRSAQMSCQTAFAPQKELE